MLAAFCISGSLLHVCLEDTPGMPEVTGSFPLNRGLGGHNLPGVSQLASSKAVLTLTPVFPVSH